MKEIKSCHRSWTSTGRCQQMTMKPQFILLLCRQNNDSYTNTQIELNLCLCAPIGLHSFTGQSEINKKFTVDSA